jgi:hypothetical protein
MMCLKSKIINTEDNICENWSKIIYQENDIYLGELMEVQLVFFVCVPVPNKDLYFQRNDMVQRLEVRGDWLFC